MSALNLVSVQNQESVSVTNCTMARIARSQNASTFWRTTPKFARDMDHAKPQTLAHAIRCMMARHANFRIVLGFSQTHQRVAQHMEHVWHRNLARAMSVMEAIIASIQFASAYWRTIPLFVTKMALAQPLIHVTAQQASFSRNVKLQCALTFQAMTPQFARPTDCAILVIHAFVKRIMLVQLAQHLCVMAGTPPIL